MFSTSLRVPGAGMSNNFHSWLPTQWLALHWCWYVGFSLGFDVRFSAPRIVFYIGWAEIWIGQASEEKGDPQEDEQITAQAGVIQQLREERADADEVFILFDRRLEKTERKLNEAGEALRWLGDYITQFDRVFPGFVETAISAARTAGGRRE